MSYNDVDKAYALATTQGCPTPIGMLPLKKRLELAVTKAEQALKDAKEAKDIFDRHPDLERLLDIMQKGGF